MLLQEPFDFWNIIKKRLHFLPKEPFFREGEIWWCSVGHNIGHEYNGKNSNFERPVLILLKINLSTAWILPITSKCIVDKYRVNLDDSQIILSQIRTVSSRRLLRKMKTDIIPFEVNGEVIDKLITLLHNAKLRSHQLDEAEKRKDSNESTI